MAVKKSKAEKDKGGKKGLEKKIRKKVRTFCPEENRHSGV